jgi:hypothetical protein
MEIAGAAGLELSTTAVTFVELHLGHLTLYFALFAARSAESIAKILPEKAEVICPKAPSASLTVSKVLGPFGVNSYPQELQRTVLITVSSNIFKLQNNFSAKKNVYPEISTEYTVNILSQQLCKFKKNQKDYKYYDYPVEDFRELKK